jgi:hypothetical protein
MDAKKSSKVFRGTQDPHPHAYWDGIIYIAYTVFDEEIGEEVERIEMIPCRRCTDRRAIRSGR